MDNEESDSIEELPERIPVLTATKHIGTETNSGRVVQFTSPEGAVYWVKKNYVREFKHKHKVDDSWAEG